MTGTRGVQHRQCGPLTWPVRADPVTFGCSRNVARRPSMPTPARHGRAGRARYSRNDGRSDCTRITSASRPTAVNLRRHRHGPRTSRTTTRGCATARPRARRATGGPQPATSDHLPGCSSRTRAGPVAPRTSDTVQPASPRHDPARAGTRNRVRPAEGPRTEEAGAGRQRETGGRWRRTAPSPASAPATERHAPTGSPPAVRRARPALRSPSG